MSGRLTISTEALAQNYRSLASASQGQTAGVVKANAYGVGIDVVVPTLLAEGCKIFFVATLIEGQRVRAICGLDPIIYVLSGVSTIDEVERFVNDDLRPVLNSSDQIGLWDTSKPYAVHVDTGMERLGFEFEDGLAWLTQQDNAPELVLTHFARADEGEHRAIQAQLDKIERLRQFQIPTSVSNSAGILLHDVVEDVARAGIALYGGSPSGALEDCLLPVIKLEARVLQVREPAEGTPVGYGGTYKTSSDEMLATVGVGYADGVSRLLSSNGQVWAGQRFNIVGRVSMDMLHVSFIGSDLKPGDYVEVIGAHVSVEEVASNAQTLSYEVLTGLDAARRLERVTTKALL